MNMRIKKKEDAALNELMSQLEQIDYSKYSDKAKVKREVFSKIAVMPYTKTNEGSKKALSKGKGALWGMKKPLVAACIIIVGISSIMQTVWAQEVVEKIVAGIKLEHIEAVQCEEDDRQFIPIPKDFEGQIFDENGNVLEKVTRDMAGKLYTKEGEKIAYLDFEQKKIVTQVEYEVQVSDMKENIVVEKDPDKIKDYICFTPKFLGYVPSGYSFDRAEFYKDEEGKVENSKYMDLYYKNAKTGKEIFMQERFACEETAYGSASDSKIEEISLNGNRAILMEGGELDWEVDGVLMHISYKEEGDEAREELIKMGESIK